MSYTLYFTRSKNTPEDKFTEYFTERQHYDIHEGHVFYENKDTGVYFRFDLEDECDFDEEGPDCWASFDINYHRPSFFAHEAAIELEAFVNYFGRTVADPQVDGMTTGEFTNAGFLRGYRSGNKFSLRGVGNQEEMDLQMFRPSEELSRIWKWNYSRDKLQSQLGDNIFVPRISFFLVGDRLVSASVWTDAIPMYIPRTDVILLYKSKLAGWRLFGKKPVMAVAEWAEIEKHLQNFQTSNEPVFHIKLDYDHAPSDVRTAFKKGGTKSSFEITAMDGILDLEFLAREAEA